MTISLGNIGLGARLLGWAGGLAGGSALWWTAGAVLVGLLAAIGVQTLRLATAHTDLAELGQQVQQDRADRLQLVAAHNLQVATMQANHAKTQQEIIGGFIDQKLKLQAAHAIDLDRARRVRVAAAAGAAADRAAAQGNSAACQRVADRNEALYSLVADGFELVVTGRDLLGQAANEITTLKQIVMNDRAAICGDGR